MPTNAAALAYNGMRPRPPDRMGPGFLLAVAVHLLLIGALALGVKWRASEPAGVEAELWASVPQVAAPKAVAPEPEPPKPAPQPPKPVVEPPPQPTQREADIATEKARKQRELKQREEEKQRELKAQQEKEQQERKELEKKKADEARKKAAEEKAQQEKLEAERKKNLDRMMGQLGGTGAPDSGGKAAQTAGPSAGYAGRIAARVKPNIVFTDPIVGDPVAEVEVKVAPDGTIIGRRLVKSSGMKEWDDAVLRAIDRTEVLPRDTDGRVPPSIPIRFRARDF